MSIEPWIVEVDGTIAASAERVFELLDFASPKNALRERGFQFEDYSGGEETRYGFRAPFLDDILFVVTVTECQRPTNYSFDLIMETETPVGAFVRSRSQYKLAALGPDQCKVELVESTWFKSGLSADELQKERALSAISVQRHMERLTLHAVEGVEAAGYI